MTPPRWLPALGAALVAALGVVAWPYTVDDAFVVARFARRIVAGAGYTMNDGPPSDAITGPLALLPALIGELTVGDPVIGSKLAGLAASALAVALVLGVARDRAHGLVTLALAVLGSTPAVWSVAGLETGLATLALTIAGLGLRAALLAGDSRAGARAGWAVGGAVAALAWLRPELALASGVVLLALWRTSRPAAVRAWALAVAGAAAIVAFRLALFGVPLPLSAQAKPPDLGHGLEYVARATVVQLGLLGPAVAWLGAREGHRPERLVLGVLVAHLVALALAGGDWMPGFRLLAPALPLYAWLAAGPIAARLATAGRRGWGLALLAACLLVPAVDMALQLGPVRDAGRAREAGGVELADWLEGHARRVAMVDVGFVPFRSGVEVVDLGGITDPVIGRLPGGHLDKRIDPGLLRARDPDAIVLHSATPPQVDERGRLVGLAGYPVEQRVARMPWVRAELRVARVIAYAPAYYYVVLTRGQP